MRCVCGHIRGLHKDGQCMICGPACPSFETKWRANRWNYNVPGISYSGRYARRYSELPPWMRR
jgi:hypothetical protein